MFFSPTKPTLFQLFPIMVTTMSGTAEASSAKRGGRGYTAVGDGSDSGDDDSEAADGAAADRKALLLESSDTTLPRPAAGAASAASAATDGPKGCVARRRYQLSLLATLGGGLAYAQRAGLAVSIVRLQSVFGWDKPMQGEVLSAFYLGYMLLQIPGGLLAATFGPRRVLGLAVLLSSACSLFSPWASRTSPWMLFAVRAAQGCCQAPIFPACSTLWSRWAPPAERSTLSSNTQVGGYIGSMVAGIAAGWQCDNPEVPLVGGWEAVFVLHGLLGLCWSLAWFVVWDVRNTPRDDSARCTAAERDYIEGALLAETARAQELAALVAASAGHATENDGATKPERKKSAAVSNHSSGLSWALARNMVRSPAMWAICIAHTSTDWVFYVMGDGTPAFLRDVVGLSLTQAGFFAAVPQLLLIAVSLLSARTADCLLRPGGRCFQRTGLVRKTFTATALLPTAVGLLLLGLLGPQLSEGVTLGVLACLSGMGGIETGGGYSVNHLDIAPANAGVVQSVKNMFGQATGCKSSLRGFASRSEQTRQCSCCRSN